MFNGGNKRYRTSGKYQINRVNKNLNSVKAINKTRNPRGGIKL